MPEELFQPLAEDSTVSLASVDELAGQFLASAVATGSRFAAAISTPCAFVFSENGKVRYASRSRALVDAYAWIAPHTDLPRGTVSQGLRAGATECSGEIDADLWFSNWERGGTLLEEARYLARWDQTLSVVWFESEEVPTLGHERRERRWEFEGREFDEPREEEDEDGLKELGLDSRWPGKKRRR